MLILREIGSDANKLDFNTLLVFLVPNSMNVPSHGAKQ